LSQRCDICGNQEARFVCSRCGRQVCLQDFRQERWLCVTCEPGTPEEPRFRSAFPTRLSWFVFASFALVFIGMAVMMIASFTQSQGPTSGGAVILIGPIPIIIGSGPESNWLILLAAIITAIALAAFLLTRRRTHN
jgi:LPXTG-motif cell wall-anchored protein